MARFFLNALPGEGTEYRLTGENAEHARVLRLRPGEAVTLCDGKGLDCPCTVAEGGVLAAGAARPCPAEPRVRVSVYLAFPKGDKAEHVIQKAVELGAAEVVLFPSRYCVSRPDDRSLGKKLDRWQKIARAAAEQSGRGVIPPVRAADSYAEALAEAARAEVPILFYENEERLSLHEALAEVGTPLIRHGSAVTPSPEGEGFGRCPVTPSPEGEGFGRCPVTPSSEGEGFGRVSVSLMTGAEGGFSEEEIGQARAAGLRICTLGPRILRCETAPLAGLTAVMYALGEM